MFLSRAPDRLQQAQDSVFDCAIDLKALNKLAPASVGAVCGVVVSAC
jgi:hypothetical protein